MQGNCVSLVVRECGDEGQWSGRYEERGRRSLGLLKPHYRQLLEEQGFALVVCKPSECAAERS